LIRPLAILTVRTNEQPRLQGQAISAGHKKR
jgi:hypothetical protein